MNCKRKLLVLSAIISSFLLLRCDEDVKDNCEIAVCTLEFRTIMISVKHANDNSAYILTDYKVVRLSDNKDITITENIIPGNNGSYPIANDSKRDLFKFKNTEVEFSGYVNNNLVIQKRLTITGDCCHISLVSGETEFVL